MIARNRFIRAAMAILFCAVSAQAAFSQIRDYVPIVRPSFHEGTIEFFTKLEESLRSDGYDSMADYVKSYKSGSFGSGFVYVAADGRNFVVTNRHVVSQADTVTLEFEKADGSQVVYKNCKVAALDEDVDIALIAFPPDAKPFKAGLSFAAAAVADGIEVWTAGYPGLGSSPSWQLGKGNVSNAVLKLPELVDPAITTLVQHSAQVDPGNSGGPLLVADAKAIGGYKVVGLNTWRVSNRQATNISIPVPAMNKFLASVLEAAPDKTRRNALESRCREFSSLVADKDILYGKLSRFVSYAYVAEKGEDAFREVIATASTEVRSAILEVFSGYSPVEGMRLALAYRLAKEAKKAPAEPPPVADAKGKKKTEAPAADASAVPFLFSTIDGDPESDLVAVPVRFSKGSAEYSFSWVVEHGKWRIKGTSLDEVKEAEEKKAKAKAAKGATSDFSFGERPSIVAFRARAAIPLDSRGIFLIGGVLSISPWAVFDVQMEALFGSMTVYDSYERRNETFTAVDIQFGTYIRLPFSFGYWGLAPFGGVAVGFLGNVDYVPGLCASFDAGLSGTIGEYDGVKASIELFYRGLLASSLAGEAVSSIGDGTANMLCLGAGIAY